MGFPTISDLIAMAHTQVKSYKMINSWVTVTGFERFYARYGARLIDGEMRTPVFDIANVVVREDRRGKGIFTGFIKDFQYKYPGVHIYVESVSDPRFGNFLDGKLKFKRTEESLPYHVGACYWHRAPAC